MAILLISLDMVTYALDMVSRLVHYNMIALSHGLEEKLRIVTLRAYIRQLFKPNG
jgi:hypothetical protein